MKFRDLLSAFTLAAVSTSVVLGQVAKPTASDQAFSDLQVVSRPLPIAPPPAGGKKTRAEFERDRQMQSAAFLAAAGRANAFYTQYPTHAKVPEAKKIEVVSMLRAVQTGLTDQEPKALRMARDYRSDDSNASIDRYHIAATVTQIDLSKKRITERTALMAEYERRAFDLYGEFPNEPAVLEMLLGVARNSDPAQARSVAGQILRMPASDNIKFEAQAVIDRLDMPGRSVAFEWQDENGKFHQVADYRGKVLVFYVWATWTAASEVAGARIGADLKPGVELISVNVDTQPDKGKNAKSKAPFAGIAYYDDRGLKGPMPIQLRADKVPAVHVVDANGVYVGRGVPSELGALLKQAGK